MWATHSKTQRASTPSNCFRPPATKQTRSACTTIKSKSEAREVQTAKVNVTTVNEKKSDRDFRFFAYDCSWGSQQLLLPGSAAAAATSKLPKRRFCFNAGAEHTVKPVLNDHRFKRPPAFSDRFFMHGESAIQSDLY